MQHCPVPAPRPAAARSITPAAAGRRETAPRAASGCAARAHCPARHAVSAAFRSRPARHAWPGNVRELRNLMQRAALFLAAQPLQALSSALLLAAAPELGNAASAEPVPTLDS